MKMFRIISKKKIQELENKIAFQRNEIEILQIKLNRLFRDKEVADSFTEHYKKLSQEDLSIIKEKLRRLVG